MLAHFESEPLAPTGMSTFSPSRIEWLKSYSGGWQLLAPNAGAECVVLGINHPFHGEVSKTAWTIESRAEKSITIRALGGNSLTVTRTISLADDAADLVVCTTIENESTLRIPAILVEHIAFAGSESARVIAPADSLWEAPPDKHGRTTAQRWSRELTEPIPAGNSRVMNLVHGSEGWVELQRDEFSVRVDWDPAQLPYLWYWQERRTEGFPFYGRSDIFGLEPASAAFGDGLAEAIRRGEAWWIDAHSKKSVTIQVRLMTNPGGA